MLKRLSKMIAYHLASVIMKQSHIFIKQTTITWK